MHSLLVLLSIVPLVYCGIPFPPVPFQYVTETEIISYANEKYVFRLPTCGGTQFDHFTANVYINSPDRKWNPVIDDVVTVHVFNKAGTEIGNNYDTSGNLVQYFHFLYHATDKDLTFNVTTGNTVVLKYTLTVNFTRCHSTPAPSENMKHRYVQTQEEDHQWEKVKSIFHDATPQDLVTVFRTTSDKEVDTADVVGLQLGYCFNPKKFPGTVEISVLATDAISAFATYACTADIPCTATGKARDSDVSGASVNFVTVHLVNATNAGPIDVLVRGDGTFEGKNHFTLAASKFKQNIKKPCF